MTQENQKPSLTLVTLTDMEDREMLAGLFKHLTGKDSTDEELDEAMAYMEELKASEGDGTSKS